MSLRADYFQLLDHLGPTVTLRELVGDPDRRDAVALRHDVDHDLDLALEMAHHEHVRGVRASYFLLHTAAYWQDPAFALKCRQLAEYGHEIGLHTNALTSWHAGRTDDPDTEIGDALARLRACGLSVDGVAAHGDRACYQHGFINYWLFRELRGDDPAAGQYGRSAEGIQVEDPGQQVPYPPAHRLVRGDGKVLDLWRSSLAGHRLRYDAAHVPYDAYWTDSGGGWNRSPDPLNFDLSRGRHQVLVHPWWWRGPTRTVFVLSTARAGSTWLARFVDQATSARGLHEWTLNHRREGNEFPRDHRTGHAMQDLLADQSDVVARLRATRAHHQLLRRDVVECNVYLDAVLPRLTTTMPNASLLHLHRDPYAVLRSLLERGWYESPEDHRHRTNLTDDWPALDQLQRAAWYIQRATEAIMHVTDHRVPMEEATGNPATLPSILAELGIVVHPLLAGRVFGAVANESKSRTVPPFEQWPEDLQQSAAAVLSDLRRSLGYPPVRGETDARSNARQTSRAAAATEDDASPNPAIATTVIGAIKQLARLYPKDRTERVIADRHALPRPHHCRCEEVKGVWSIRTIDADPTAHVMLCDSHWHKAGPGAIPVREGHWNSVHLTAAAENQSPARVFVLWYDQAGRPIDRRHEADIRRGPGTIRLSTVPPHGARSLALAVHIGIQNPQVPLRIESWRIESRPFPAHYHVAARLRERKPPALPVVADPSVISVPPGLRARMRAHHARKKLFQPCMYEQLLADFRDTHECLRLDEYVRQRDLNGRSILLVRHDVDHDDETALRMARWEHDRGIRATYCLLHTAWYWGVRKDGRASRFDELLRFGDALIDLGHEINLHNNAVTVGLTEGINPVELLAEELEFMRRHGWPITGTTAHGDRLCREFNYNNAELFAEAVKPERGGARLIQGPGGSVQLGHCRYADLGLEYEAYDIERDLYLSDSGGRLRGQRNAPGRRAFARHDPSQSRVVGILTHPIWWDFDEA